ncbi:AfsR/SARP family transcriptional regulator [Nocardiopsis tropica]|nr:AfsR/SARP family transcriptional regulator [Nocardiopsis tropica]
MDFRLLGPLEVMDDSGNSIPINRKKHRQLLAALLVRANTAVPCVQLINNVWGEDPPRSARGNLKTYVSQLRQRIDRIETSGEGYRIRVGEHELDSAVFAAMLRRGLRTLEEGRPAEAARTLEEALGLWRGATLQDTPLDGDLALTHTHLDEQRLTCFETLMDIHLSQGRHTEVLARLYPVIGSHPLHERLWGLQMTALYRDGRCAEALAAYRTMRARLVEELGVDPSPELERLHGQILARDPALSSPAGLPPRPAHRRPAPRAQVDAPVI